MGRHRNALQRTHVERRFAGAVGQLHARLLANLRGPVGGDGTVHRRHIDYGARTLIPACRATACLSADRSSAFCSISGLYLLKELRPGRATHCIRKNGDVKQGMRRTSAKAGSSWSYGTTPPCSRLAPSHSRRRPCVVQVALAHKSHAVHKVNLCKGQCRICHARFQSGLKRTVSGACAGSQAAEEWRSCSCGNATSA